MPRIMRPLLALLLVCASVCTQLAHADDIDRFLITPSDVKKVSASAQVSSTQLFTRSWQIRANPSQNASAIYELAFMSGTRVFVSHVEAPASAGSDALAEIRFSGNSEAIVKYNNVTSSESILSPLDDKNAVLSVRSFIHPSLPKQASYLLTEVLLYKKRQLKRVDVRVSNAVDDIVIEDNVLFTTTKDVAKTSLVRTPAAGAALKAEKYSDEFGSAVHVEPIKDANTTRAVKLGLKTTFTGNITFRVSCDLSTWGRSRYNVARVTAGPYERPATDVQYNVTVSPAADFDTLVVHVNSTLAALKSVGIIVFVETLPSVQVELADLPSNVDVQDACDIDGDPDTGLNFQLDGVTRNAFIVDKDATLFATEAKFNAPIGNLQVEVKELTTSALALQSLNGNINYFSTSATTSGSIAAAPNFGAKVCLASSNDLKVAYLDSRKSSQVSYPGHTGGNTFTCTKVAALKRVPGPVSQTGATEEISALSPSADDKSSSAKSSASRFSESRAVAFALLVVALIAAM